MRVITVLALTAFLSSTIGASFTPAYAAARGAMSGKGDYATRGYNQGALNCPGFAGGSSVIAA